MREVAERIAAPLSHEQRHALEAVTGPERLAFGVLFFIPECLPDLADLTDLELREALQTTMRRTLRVPSCIPGRSRLTGTMRTRPGRPPE